MAVNGVAIDTRRDTGAGLESGLATPYAVNVRATVPWLTSPRPQKGPGKQVDPDNLPARPDGAGPCARPGCGGRRLRSMSAWRCYLCEH